MGRAAWGKLRAEKQRGAQENLWPKFILKSAPLRATSSGVINCTHCAIPNSLKILDASATEVVGISEGQERITSPPKTRTGRADWPVEIEILPAILMNARRLLSDSVSNSECASLSSRLIARQTEPSISFTRMTQSCRINYSDATRHSRLRPNFNFSL